MLQEAILDRLPYPLLNQRLRDVGYASAVSSELGQAVQVLPTLPLQGLPVGAQYRPCKSITCLAEKVSVSTRNGVDFVHHSLKRSWQCSEQEKRAAEMAARVDGCGPKSPPLLEGGWSEALRQTVLCVIVFRRKVLKNRYESSALGTAGSAPSASAIGSPRARSASSDPSAQKSSERPALPERATDQARSRLA